MREQIKKMMNKEEGFTLVELLAVIVILAIILAIAIPAVGNVINKAQSDANTEEVKLVEDAARLYFIAESGKEDVTVSTLISGGYLEVRDEDDAEGTKLKARYLAAKGKDPIKREDVGQGEFTGTLGGE